MMLVKIGAALAGAVLVGTLTAPAAFARDDDAHGGHCRYGDFSINIMPSCNTASSGSGSDDGSLGELPPLHGGTRPPVDDLDPAR